MNIIGVFRSPRKSAAPFTTSAQPFATPFLPQIEIMAASDLRPVTHSTIITIVMKHIFTIATILFFTLNSAAQNADPPLVIGHW